MDSSTYKPEDDNEIKGMLIELKKLEDDMNDIKSIFEKEKSITEDIIQKRKEVLKNLAEIKIKKDHQYKECIDTNINKNKDMKCYAILNLYTKSFKYK